MSQSAATAAVKEQGHFEDLLQCRLLNRHSLLP